MSSAGYVVTRCTRRKSDGEVCKIRYIVVYEEAMIMPTKIRNLGHALFLSLLVQIMTLRICVFSYTTQPSMLN
jgi:hypothetical protein